MEQQASFERVSGGSGYRGTERVNYIVQAIQQTNILTHFLETTHNETLNTCFFLSFAICDSSFEISRSTLCMFWSSSSLFVLTAGRASSLPSSWGRVGEMASTWGVYVGSWQHYNTFSTCYTQGRHHYRHPGVGWGRWLQPGACTSAPGNITHILNMLYTNITIEFQNRAEH